jgi:hypothetical protein
LQTLILGVRNNSDNRERRFRHWIGRFEQIFQHQLPAARLRPFGCKASLSRIATSKMRRFGNIVEGNKVHTFAVIDCNAVFGQCPSGGQYE